MAEINKIHRFKFNLKCKTLLSTGHHFGFRCWDSVAVLGAWVHPDLFFTSLWRVRQAGAAPAVFIQTSSSALFLRGVILEAWFQMVLAPMHGNKAKPNMLPLFMHWEILKLFVLISFVLFADPAFDSFMLAQEPPLNNSILLLVPSWSASGPLPLVNHLSFSPLSLSTPAICLSTLQC